VRRGNHFNKINKDGKGKKHNTPGFRLLHYRLALAFYSPAPFSLPPGRPDTSPAAGRRQPAAIHSRLLAPAPARVARAIGVAGMGTGLWLTWHTARPG